MPKLKNYRHELFALGIHRGMNQSDAYMGAGYKTTTPESTAVEGSKLVRNPKVQARLDELAREACNAAKLTRQWVIEEQMDVLRQAKIDRNWAAANQALKNLGSEVGALQERRHITVRHLHEMSMTEIEDAERRALQQLIDLGASVNEIEEALGFKVERLTKPQTMIEGNASEAV